MADVPEKDNQSTTSTKPTQKVEIKRGDYQVHFFLEEARSLMPKEEGDTVDPIVGIKCFGKTKYTKAMDDIGGTAAVYWGQHFFFNATNLDRQTVENSRIQIEVKDHRFLIKDAMIGNYEMDLSYVYFQPGHSIVHNWIVLANSEEEDFQSVRGYLKFGCSVLAEGDEQVDLTIPEKNESGDSDLILPPQITTQQCQLIIRAVKAEGLPKMDEFGGTCDAMLEADFSGCKMKTAHKSADEATYSAYWLQDIYMPVIVPCVTGKLVIRVWDWDPTSANDIIGTVTLNWHDIQAGKYADYFWVNIYRAPLDVSGENTDKMNSQPHTASYWGGRVLLKITTEKIKKPKTKVVDIEEEDFMEKVRGEFEQGPEWEIRAQVYAGVALPPEKSDYKIAVRWGDIDMESQELESHNGRCDWYETLKRKVVYFPGEEITTKPDVFVYLRNGDDNVCYMRYKPELLTDPNVKADWIQLLPDKAVGKVKNDWEGGYIRIRLFVGIFGDSEDTISSCGWDSTPPKPSGKTHTLMCNLYQCKQLPAADSDANSDPYVKFYCAGAEVSTGKEERENTLNPMWYRSLPMQIICDNVEDAPPVIVYVMDHDMGLDDDDLLGICVVNLDVAAMNSPEPVRPEWYQLSMGKPGSELGEILMSFNVFSTSSIPSFNLMPEVTDTTVEINVLGLRDLTPAVGWVPVNKPFVKFDLNSLQIPGEELKIRNVQTQPVETGTNPNINTVIRFDMKMPVDPLFCPALTASVYDYLFMGLSQPLIGTFVIELGSIFHKVKKPKVRAKKIVSLLKKAQQEEAKRKEEEALAALAAPEVGVDDVLVEEVKQPSSTVPSGTQPAVEEVPVDAPAETPEVPVEIPGAPGETPEGQDETVDPSDPSKPVDENEDRLATVPPTPRGEGVEGEVLEGEEVILPEEKPIVRPDPETCLMAGVSRAAPIKMETSLQVKNARKGGFVVMPTYKKNDESGRMEEINCPDPEYYHAVGYDKQPGDGVMHYRYVVKSELEESDYIDKSPFLKYEILKGQERGLSDSIFSDADRHDASGQGSNVKTTGLFKAICRVSRPEEEEKKQEKLAKIKEQRESILKQVANRQFGNAALSYLTCVDEDPEDDEDEDFEVMTKQLLQKTECVIRVYILDAFELASRDERSLSDPYVLVKVGDRTVGNPQDYKTDETSCGFYQYFELETVLPGPGILTIAVMDHDDFFSDELIGKTKIDLEDRFFSTKWQRLPEKPIETRTLFHKSTKLEQGTVRCWVDIVPKKQMMSSKIWCINPRPPAEFEARLIIWHTDDVICEDYEGTSDIYIKAWINNCEPKETDTHFRCQNGTGSFNWRMKFPITIPEDIYRCSIQIWDRDILSFNDFISDATFEFKQLAMDAWVTGRRVKRNGPQDLSLFRKKEKGDDEKFWIDCKRRNKKMVLEDGGRVQISFELVPIQQAKSVEVGNGREEPNIDPYLPDPTGRIQWSWNPWTMFCQLVGPGMRCKICCCICCILCIALCVMIGPMTVSNAVSSVIF